MGKYADYILLQFMAFIAALTVCALLDLSTPVCFGSAFLSAIAVGLGGAAIANRGKKQGFVSYSKWCFLCRAGGDEELKKVAMKVFSITRAVHEENGIIYAGEYAVAAFARFSPLSLDMAAACFRKCRQQGVTLIHILSTNKEPKALALGGRMGLKVKALSFRKFYRIACDAGAVPTKVKEKRRRLETLKTTLPLMFTRGAAVRFCFAALVLALLAFLTPLKNYYLIVSAITLTLSFISLAMSFKGYTVDEGPLTPPPAPPISPRKGK